MPRKSSARRAGVAAVAMTGAIALGLGSPTAFAADPSDSLQPTIDQLLVAMDAAVEVNREFPNMTPLNEAMLPDAVQTHMFKNLATLLNQLSAVEYATRQPEMLAGSGANSRKYFGANNPDNIYLTQNIDPTGSYLITLDPGPGTVDLNITTGNLSLLFPSAGGTLSLSQLTPNSDGTYSIVVSPTRPDDALNWLESTGYNTIAIRNSLGDWAAPATDVTIENVGGTEPSPAIPGVTSTGLSDEAIAYLLTTLAETTQVSNMIWATGYGGLIGRGPENDFLPIEGTIGEGALAGQATSFGRYNLQPDEALVLTVPAITTAYSGIQLTNAIGQSIGYSSEQTSLSNAQVVPNADGTITYVVSALDPGVPNWLDTTGLDTGNVLLRWQNYSGEIPETPIEAVVVPVADVMNHVPEGTPAVTPRQRSRALKERMLSYNYMLNATKDPSWVMLNLQMDDLEAAMGTENFEAVLGEQPVAPLSDRFSREMRPQWGDVAWSVLTNPLGSFSAVLETLPQAVNDIQLPVMLAVVRTAKVVAETNEAVVAALQSGRLDLAVKAIGTGMAGVAAVLHESLTDPNTSITAGLLNARDDLALQVSRADEYDPPTLGSLLSSLQETAEVSVTNARNRRVLLEEIRAEQVPEAVEDTEPAAAVAAEDEAIETAMTEETATEETTTEDSVPGGEVIEDVVIEDVVTEDVVTEDDALDDEITEGSATDDEVTNDEAALDEAALDEATDDEAALDEATDDEAALDEAADESAGAEDDEPGPDASEDDASEDDTSSDDSSSDDSGSSASEAA